MAGEKYGDKALVKLADYFDSNFATSLRTVETAQGLASGALTDPVEIVRPMVADDGRAPLMEIYLNDGEPVDHKNGITVYDCTITVTYHGDADVAAGSLFMRRYMTAVVDTIADDRSLGGTVQAAIDLDQGFRVIHGKDSPTKHVIALGVEVHVHDP